ncbi:MAG: Gfo/Idh/MocA family oxidoreductase [Planctomycetes bacterium]|nr:Gfo/Idh/MocA family oxidoreductase [Planctomycetota bacterium]
MKQVKLAVIGLGYIGRCHLEKIAMVGNIEIVAVCSRRKQHAQEIAAKYNCRAFTDYRKLLASKVSDAVLIATPHYSHTAIGIDALKAGCHVLVEKPISVHKADCQKLIAAHTNQNQVFAAMFNQRTLGAYKKIKSMIDGGELGKLMRVNWIITDWFRTDAYYSSGSWRATWVGEGGGVLLNQCPHQLDLLQWLCGMPSKVAGFCGLGKHHDIEVEDEVTAYLEFPNGATGVFIASTGEAPGTNRLEICGEKGKVVLEGENLRFSRNEIPCSQFQKTSKEPMAKPRVSEIDIDIEVTSHEDQRAEIIKNFANAILNGEKLIAPAAEGINSVELANAILYSSLTQKPVQLPLNAQTYEAKLQELINNP